MDDVKRTLIVNDLQSRIDNLQKRIDTLRNNLETKDVCCNVAIDKDFEFVCSNCGTQVTLYFESDSGDDFCYFICDDEDSDTDIKYCPKCGDKVI